MKCPSCNAEVHVGMFFCPECGKRLPDFQETKTRDVQMGVERIIFPQERNEREELRNRMEDQKKVQELKRRIQKLRCEISQLHIAVKQKNTVSRYRDPDFGQPQFPPQNLRKKEQIEKVEETESKKHPYLMGCLVLYVAVIFSYFIGWIKIEDFGNTTLTIIKIANMSESFAFLLFYIVPVLYLIGIIRLWMEQDLENTEWVHLPFVANVLVFVISLILVLGSKSGDGFMDLFECSLAVGPWLSLVCGTIAEILAIKGTDSEENYEIKKNIKKIKFAVPVVNYNALLFFRPLRIVVNEEGELDVELKQYVEGLNLLQMNITLVSQLHNVYRFWDVQVRNFRKQSNGIIRGTAVNGVYEGPEDIVYAKVDILQYSFDTGLAQVSVPISIESQLSLERLKALRKTMKDAFHEPVIMGMSENISGDWFCVCGTENHADEESCILCGKKKQGVFQIKREI